MVSVSDTLEEIERELDMAINLLYAVQELTKDVQLSILKTKEKIVERGKSEIQTPA